MKIEQRRTWSWISHDRPKEGRYSWPENLVKEMVVPFSGSEDRYSVPTILRTQHRKSAINPINRR